MTRVVVTSDLHLGVTTVDQIRALRDRIATEQPDLTVVAGDVGECIENFVRCLALLRDLPGQLAVLPGNHDVWARGSRHSRDLLERDLPDVARGAGAIWLEGATWGEGRLAVVGSVAWYDYSAVDSTLSPMPSDYYANAKVKSRYSMDAHLVDWSWSDLDFARDRGEALYAHLAELDADGTVAAIVIVTHVPLVEEQLCRMQGSLRSSTRHAYFGNLTLGRRVLACRKVAAIISGHTHVGRRATIVGAGGTVEVVVVPSDYGSPGYVALDCMADGQTLSINQPPVRQNERFVRVVDDLAGSDDACPTQHWAIERVVRGIEGLVGAARRGGAVGGNAVEAMRRKAWLDSRPSYSRQRDGPGNRHSPAPVPNSARLTRDKHAQSAK
jgi:hypothetical protein